MKTPKCLNCGSRNNFYVKLPMYVRSFEEAEKFKIYICLKCNSTNVVFRKLIVPNHIKII